MSKGSILPRSRALGRWTRRLVIGAAVVLVALYLGVPTALAIVSIAPDRGSAGPPPEGFDTVRLVTDDGVALAAWYAPPENGAAIAVLHGAGAGRGTLRPYLAMLRRGGYGVLAVSARGYDESEGRIQRKGWWGTEDVGAAVRFLDDRPEVRAIGAMGISMGGEMLLGAASSYPQVAAIAVDGATHRGVDEYVALPSNRPLVRSFTHHVFTYLVSLFGGRGQPRPPILASVRAAEGTAFLFIAAGNEPDEIAYGALYQQATAVRSTLWTIAGVGHTAGWESDPAAYEARVMGFFDEVLGP